MIEDDRLINEALSIAITSKRERADQADPETARRFDREADDMDDLLQRRHEEASA